MPTVKQLWEGFLADAGLFDGDIPPSERMAHIELAYLAGFVDCLGAMNDGVQDLNDEVQARNNEIRGEVDCNGEV